MAEPVQATFLTVLDKKLLGRRTAERAAKFKFNKTNLIKIRSNAYRRPKSKVIN